MTTSAYIVPTGHSFICYSPVEVDGEFIRWFDMRFPNRAIAEKWEARQTQPVIWTEVDFYGRLPWDRAD